MCPPRVCRRVALKSFFCCRRIPFNVESCGIAREQIICLADNATIFAFSSRSDNVNGQKWHKLTKQPIVVVFVGRLCLFFSVAFVLNRLAAAGCKFLSGSFPSFVWPKLPLINKKTYDWNKDKVSNAQLSREHLQRSHCPTSLTSLSRASVALVLWLPICDYTTLQQLPPLTGLRHLVASLRWQLEAD